MTLNLHRCWDKTAHTRSDEEESQYTQWYLSKLLVQLCIVDMAALQKRNTSDITQNLVTL